MIENSYNEFLKEKIFNLFNNEEAKQFMEESEKPRPTIIRTNILKIRRKDLAKLLIQRGMDVDPLEWSNEALIVYKSPVPVGATPEYLTGLYTIQGASSLLPVLSLDVKPELQILDMCAAPGGKSSHIAALMNNTGVLYLYDNFKTRIKALQSNIARLGITNSLIICNDARKISNGSYDRILLDAPCSGTGTINKDGSIKTKYDARDLKSFVMTQKELISKAFKLLKVGGVMVYSTCSILPEENEEIVDYLLRKKNGARLAELNVDIGRNGFSKFRGEHYHPSLKMTRRIFPHTHNMDGFFVAKITKYKK